MPVPFIFANQSGPIPLSELDTDFSSCFDFLQTGTGAVSRPVSTKLKDVISVRDFGAVGDNTTDNYTAFVTALAALNVNGGGVLYVPGGAQKNYLFKTQAGVSPSIGIPSNVTILADMDVYYQVQGGASASGVNTYGTALFKNSDMVNGNKNIAIIGGRFKSTTAVNCGGFIAFKNVINYLVKDVQLLDIVGTCRFQASYCLNGRLLDGVVDYETPHATPWSFEDGLRVGSGSLKTVIANWQINSGDDCIAINNEISETQMAITPQTGIPAYNALGANINGVTINNVHLSNQLGNAIRIYQGPTITTGTITRIEINNVTGSTKSNLASGGSAISLFDNSGITTNAISDVTFNNMSLDCSQLGAGASQSAVNINTTGGNIKLDKFTLLNVSVPYGIAVSGTTASISALNGNITGCLSDGIIIAGANSLIQGNGISGTGGAGIHLLNGSSHTRLIGNRIPTSTGAAIQEDAGATYTYAEGNDVVGAAACVINTNTGSVYMNNPGYNPIGGVAITVGASPFTYTTGNSYETVSWWGGTITNLVIAGNPAGLVTGAFTMAPHTAITFTYTVVPTVYKYVN